MAERVSLNPNECLDLMSRVVDLIADNMESQKKTEQIVKDVAEKGNIAYLDLINDNFEKETKVVQVVQEAAEENKEATVRYVEKFAENEQVNPESFN